MKEDVSTTNAPETEMVNRPQLPAAKEEYWKLLLEEKAERYPLDSLKSEEIFSYFQRYLKSIEINLDYNELYEEYDSVLNCYEEKIQKVELDKAIKLVIYICNLFLTNNTKYRIIQIKVISGI